LKNFKMGASFLKSPKTEKQIEDGENKRMKYGVSSMQGWRTEMEDAHVSQLNRDGSNDDVSLFGVFDGHCGAEVAQYCASNWPTSVRSLSDYPNNLQQAMRRSFFLLDENLLDPSKSSEFLNHYEARRRLDARKRSRCEDRDVLEREVRARMDDANSKGTLSSDEALAIAEIMSELEKGQKDQCPKITEAGCTAICAAIKGKKLVVANAGDSRGVLCRKNGAVVPLSEDHKPNNLTEHDRISKAGGWVFDGRVNGQLALSRAIGDFDFKKNKKMSAEDQAVTCDPDVMVIDLEEGDEFMILACDGIWDVVTNEEAVSFIREGLRTEQKISTVVSNLLDHCLAANATGNMLGTDNMTCLVVVFKEGAF
jgi:protein phosphatase 1G